jgi:hypothetical protein
MSPTLSPRVSVPQYNQGDLNTTNLTLTVTHQNGAMDLTGATISVVFQKSDGKIVYQDTTNGITVTDALNGKLDIMLNAQTRSVPGLVTGAVRVTFPGNKIIETEKFTFNVEASLASDQALASNNDFQAIVQVLNLNTGLYSSTTSYSYDPATGLLKQTQEIDPNNKVLKTTTYSYDSSNRLYQTIEVYSTCTLTTTFSYDNNGNLSQSVQTLT